MGTKRTFGLNDTNDVGDASVKKVIQYINLKLAADGYPTFESGANKLLEMAKPLLNNHNITRRLLPENLSPIEQRIQSFVDDYLSDVPGDNKVTFPSQTFTLDKHGLARVLSMPPDADKFETDVISSYRTTQGIVNNPRSDRRTTKGVFHVAEGGLPIANDKKAVPKETFCKLLQRAFEAPSKVKELPLTANQEEKAELFVSLMLRPIVVPAVPGVSKEKSMEVRFIAPGSLVSNLDFVESIFGNAGDPLLPENDAALDPEHWTGHTGCVILAPHLNTYTKKELGLPNIANATERQIKDGMCWEQEDELYNDGSAFKITCRDERGVVITLISDNYYGYCKKETKTMISYSANLFGLAEEEHAGGALASPSYNLGEKFYLDKRLPSNGMTFAKLLYTYADFMELMPEGYAVDKNKSSVIYVPEDSLFDLDKQSIEWKLNGEPQKIKLLPNKYYIYPGGYRVEMKKRIEGPKYHLVGTIAESTLCHKPCTVSGGGKSEISKSIKDAMIQGSVYVTDLQADLDAVQEVMEYDFTTRFKDPADYSVNPPRSILSTRRSLGSVIKLLTPNEDYTDAYNEWLTSFPQRVKVLIYVIKGNYNPEWGKDWRKYFSVDKVNGQPGNELKLKNSKVLSNYLRVGLDIDKSWRTFLLRQDFNPAAKVQVEDDISASIVLKADKLEYLNTEYKNESFKILTNCESRLFQRPDDCVHKGYDKQAEADLSSPQSFLSNFEPLTRAQVQEIKDDATGFELYTQPVKDLINTFLSSDSPEFLAIPSEPRIVDGKPTKNPRYLQVRPDLVDDTDKYVLEMATRIYRKVPADKAVHLPVNAVLPGRRNNPAEPENNVPPLAVYNPIHYQELPELFIDFICSVTGKSPSTTGFGSEGALTKGPFNNLLPATDLNNTFLSYILTGYAGFSSAAGYVGPKYKVDHDVSLLVPEIWCRMSVEERDPKFLIENGMLEKVNDFDFNGKKVEASLLGYRITEKFVKHFMGRIFSKPDSVFSEDMLQPELQDMDAFAASVDNLSITQRRVAEGFLTDGTYEALCPPLKALIKIMVDGTYKGKDREHPDIRKMFDRDTVLSSDWYKARLVKKQEIDIAQWTKNVAYLESKLGTNVDAIVDSIDLQERYKSAKDQLEFVSKASYLEYLEGTIGADTLLPIAE